MIAPARRAVLLSMLCCACDVGGETPGGAGEVVHPLDEERLSASVQVPVINIAYDPGATLPAWLAPLARFNEEAAVGLFDARGGSTSFVFGSLIDAQVDPSGRVLLLDEDGSAVRVLDRALDPVAVVGRTGEGPGEFRGPAALLAAGDSGFSVLDAGASQIDRFLLTESGFEPTAVLSLSAVPNPSAACFTGGQHFVQGLRLSLDGKAASRDELRTADRDAILPGKHTLHQIDDHGQVVHSFSDPYRGSLPYGGRDALLLASWLSEGKMTCADGHLWVAYLVLGEVHALDAAGNLRWVVRISDYDFPGYRFRWSAEGQPLQGSANLNLDLEAGTPYQIERLTYLSLLSPDLLALGVHRQSVGAAADGYPQTFAYWTYLLSPDNGELLGAFRAGHEVIGGGHGKAVLYRAQPYPQIVVVEAILGVEVYRDPAQASPEFQRPFMKD